MALDDERTGFRYHHLVRQLLRAELRIRGTAREQSLHLKAAEWFESTGDRRRAARHFLAARQAERALTLLQDRVVTDILRDPALSAPPVLSMIDSALPADAPDRVLTQFTEQALSITTRRWPLSEFPALLDRATILSARGQVRDALATVGAARQVLAGTGSVLLARADELEALLRLSLGDLRSAAELASALPAELRS